MLTLDAVRAAVLSDQPWSRLDELVRSEQNAGRKVKEIYDALSGMADEIDRTPGLTEDGSDAFGDTLDALTGYCREDCQYRDQPNTAPPTEEEVAKLPRWARVAFAARCARRVFPLLSFAWREATSEHRGAVGQAITVAESSATQGRTHTGTELALRDSLVVAERASASSPQSPKIAVIVINAARVAAFSAKDRLSPAVENRYAATAGDLATGAASVIPLAEAALRNNMRRDFDHLARLAEAYEWTDDTPVPPEVFGPLWSEGPPKGWPAAEVPARTELAIEAFARDRATEQMIEDDVVNLFNALNRYHIARSGVRLTLEQFRSLLPSLVPAEA
ncbi:MAG TPA: hypothetical protein VM529_09145 [Gemmata sp.]|nr:hypothetical protein [Gemmata sp.]